MRQNMTYGLYFVLSFLSTGLQSIIPQFHFARIPHETVWVGACLFVGALAAIGAVRQVSHGRFPGRTTNKAVVGGLGLLWMCLILGFRVASPWLFIALYTASRALVYAILDVVDRSLAAGWQMRDDHHHAERVAVMQLVGLIVAPIWFAWGGQGWWQAMVLTGILGGSAWAGWQLPPAKPGVTDRGTCRNRRDRRWTPGDAWFATYILAVASLAALFAASAVFLLHVLYRSHHPVAAAGVLLTLMNLAAVATALLMTRIQTQSRRTYHVWHGAVALGFLLVTAVLWGVNDRLYGILVALGIMAGVCYGVFEVLARQDATRPFHQKGEVRLLRLFNNVVSYATVITSLVLLACSLLAHTAAGVGTLVLLALMGLSGVSVLAVTVVSRYQHHQSSRPPLSISQ